jgi:hypothetical protein
MARIDAAPDLEDGAEIGQHRLLDQGEVALGDPVRRVAQRLHALAHPPVVDLLT